MSEAALVARKSPREAHEAIAERCRFGVAEMKHFGLRGVSSTVKLSVSKTELGGSNPSAPASS